MVLGSSGTGKKTLISYLNNIPLVCTKEKGKWAIKLQYENLTLNGGFGIENSAVIG
jgi:ABC-type phosphate transport system ATPase subunit